jgi:hypothetical protein
MMGWGWDGKKGRALPTAGQALRAASPFALPFSLLGLFTFVTGVCVSGLVCVCVCVLPACAAVREARGKGGGVLLCFQPPLILNLINHVSLHALYECGSPVPGENAGS